MGYFVIGLIMGVICAAIASNKGRSAVGWFLIGFLLGLIGLIICLCVSNLKEQELKEEAIQREQTRLNERLKQEQIKNQQFQQHVRTRLDVHDSKLQIDTRASDQLAMGAQPKQLATRSDPDAPDYQNWYFSLNGERQGPVSKDVVLGLLQAGTIDEEALVYHSILGDWQPAATILRGERRDGQY